MRRNPAQENRTQAIVELTRSGLAPGVLRDRVLPRLQRVVPFDAAFWTTVDPVTLLFTAPHQMHIPPDTVPYFLDNEFLGEDVNKFTALARDRAGVGTLTQRTAGDMEISARYRDIFRPLGLGDELRAVLRAGDACWGCICLHREAGVAFQRDEVEYVRRLAKHLAHGIRSGLLAAALDARNPGEAPGLVVLAPDGSLMSVTESGRRWLDALGYPEPERFDVPPLLRGLAARLQHADTVGAPAPQLSVQTPAGRWATLHASHLPAGGGGAGATAVIIEESSPSQLAPVLMHAYGLTSQERSITSLVCRAMSTQEISLRLHISANTVQDHLKSIFDKTGVRSRRELVATILREQYLPRARTGQTVAPSGFFES